MEKKTGYMYSVTIDFLRHLGLSNLEDLPEYERFKAVAKSIKEEGDTDERAGGDEQIC